jgi:UDP-glucose 6-dehydrogenase
MRHIANNLGIDANKIFMYSAISCEGMWNPAYGIKDRGPFSGACLPKDTQAFHDWAQMNGFDTTLLKTVIKVNNKHIRKLGVPKSKKYEEIPL